jgi:ribosomal protein S18 acetylase RimI-like enzyme
MNTFKSNLTFRPIQAEDEPFLFTLYSSTREEELAQTGWSDAEKETFLRQQFKAQHTHYMQHFSAAKFDIIYLDTISIGRLYIDRRVDEIRLIDIAILPEYRNKGFGSVLIKNILTEAEHKNLPVRIHVEQFNPAIRLYRRLGFKELNNSGIYLLMEWIPGSPNRVQSP